MKKLIIIICLAVCWATATKAQTTRKLLCDETELVTTAKTIKIECSNEKVFALMRKGLNIKKWSATVKKDRVGEYVEYRVSFKPADLPIIHKFFATLK